MTTLTLTGVGTISLDAGSYVGPPRAGECRPPGAPAGSLCEGLAAAFPSALPPLASWRQRGALLLTPEGVLLEDHRTLASYGFCGAAPPPLTLAVTGCAVPALDIAAAEGDARGGVASISAPAPSVSRVTTLEGTVHDVVHSLDGASCGARRSDSLHGLLLQLSPRYGAFFFSRVAERLGALQREGGGAE